MAALHVALGWRLGWPISLACVGSHLICRFDDGSKTINIESTLVGDDGSFGSPPDEFYREEYDIPQCALDCGSDLRAVTRRELLGLFVGLRARHLENVNRLAEAERDYLLARYLFPRNRHLCISQIQISVQCSMELFEPHERGHPTELAMWLDEVVRKSPWRLNSRSKSQSQALEPEESRYVADIDTIFASIGRMP